METIGTIASYTLLIGFFLLSLSLFVVTTKELYYPYLRVWRIKKARKSK